MAHMTIDLDTTTFDRSGDTTTVDRSADAADERAAAVDSAERAADDRHHERLRSTLPAVLAVALLFGVVLAGGIVLRDLASFGLWFAGQF